MLLNQPLRCYISKNDGHLSSLIHLQAPYRGEEGLCLPLPTVDTELTQVTCPRSPDREAAAAELSNLLSPIPVKLPKNRTCKQRKVTCRLQKAGKTEEEG